MPSTLAATPTAGHSGQRPKRIGQLLETYGVVVPFVIVLVACALLVPQFATLVNASNVLVNAAIVAIAGVGMTFIIALRGLDLSIGSIQGAAACVAATFISLHGVTVGIGGGLLIGALIGAVNGYLVGYLRVPSFVATLGTMGIVRGAALLLADGGTLSAPNATLETLATGRILFFPVPFVIACVLLALAYVVLYHTPLGRHVCAVGGSPEAATDSGISVRRVTFIAFVLSGLTAGLAGVLLCGQLGSANGSLGIGLELQVIAVVVLGGTSLAGGAGNVLGTLIASLLVAMIGSALNLMNVPSYYQYLATGVLLIAALALDSLRRHFYLKEALRSGNRL